MVRLYFKDINIRDNFFKDILNYSNLNTWKEFRIKFKISRTGLERYKNGKSTLPGDVYKNFLSILPNNLRSYYSLRIDSKEDNWGNIIGGKNNYLKNKHIYDLGRKKAWKAIRRRYKINNIEINKSLSLDFYEFIGTFIGDGCLNKYRSHYSVQFAGDSRYDLEYYKDKIIPPIFRLLGRKPYIRIKENCMWVTFYSKYLFLLLTRRFKMPIGKKVYTVKIPNEIIKNKEKLVYTLRGIFDTDGCVYFDRRKTYRKPYVRIELQLTNKMLINQIAISLNSLNIGYGTCIKRKNRINKAYSIQINGSKEVQKYLKIIGFSNPRHLKKLKLIEE